MRNQRGLTLLELIVSISVGIILTVAGIPAYQQFAKSSARSAASVGIYRALVLARSEAINRNREIIVCARDVTSDPDFPQCINAVTTDWDGGWIVFADSTNLFASTEPDYVEDIIAVFHEVSNHVQVTHDLGTTKYVTFDGGGRSTAQFKFSICDKGAELEGRQVSMKPSGTVSLRTLDCTP